MPPTPRSLGSGNGTAWLVTGLGQALNSASYPRPPSIASASSRSPARFDPLRRLPHPTVLTCVVNGMKVPRAAGMVRNTLKGIRRTPHTAPRRRPAALTGCRDFCRDSASTRWAFLSSRETADSTECPISFKFCASKSNCWQSCPIAGTEPSAQRITKGD